MSVLCERKCGRCSFFKKKWSGHGEDKKSCEDLGVEYESDPMEFPCYDFDPTNITAALQKVLTELNELSLGEVRIVALKIVDLEDQKNCELIHNKKIGEEVSHTDKRGTYKGRIVKMTEDSITFITPKGETFKLKPTQVTAVAD